MTRRDNNEDKMEREALEEEWTNWTIAFSWWLNAARICIDCANMG